MAQRNPMNQRYTGEQKQGKTRKSAASARPARKAGDSVRMKSSKPAKTGGLLGGASKSPEQKAQEKDQRAAAQRDRDLAMTVGGILMEQNDQYKKLRRIWWIVLVVAIVATLASWILQFQFPDLPPAVAMTVLVIAYIAIISTLALDLIKIRPIRNNARKLAASMSRKQQERIVYEERAKLDEKKAAKKAKSGKAAPASTDTKDAIGVDGAENAAPKKKGDH